MNQQYMNLTQEENLATHIINFDNAAEHKIFSTAVPTALSLAFYYRNSDDLVNAVKYLAYAAKHFPMTNSNTATLVTHLCDADFKTFFAPFNTRVPLGHIINNQLLPNALTDEAAKLDLVPYHELPPVTDVEVQATAEALRFNTTIHTLRLAFTELTEISSTSIIEMLKKNHHIQTLDLTQTNITDETLKQLAQIIGTNHPLKHLYVGWNLGTTASQLKALILATANNTHLETLDFGWDIPTDNSGELTAALQKNAVLTSLGDISEDNPLSTLLMRNNNLKSVTIQVEKLLTSDKLFEKKYYNSPEFINLIKTHETLKTAGCPENSKIYQEIVSTVMLNDIYQAYQNNDIESASQKISALTINNTDFPCCQHLIMRLLHTEVMANNVNQTPADYHSRLLLFIRLIPLLTSDNEYRSLLYKIMQERSAKSRPASSVAAVQSYKYYHQSSFARPENAQPGSMDDNGFKPLRVLPH